MSSQPSLSWAHRDEPSTIEELCEWLERVSAPHLAVIVPDRCKVVNNANSASPLDTAPALEIVRHHTETLCDEIFRACDWLEDHGYIDAPVRPRKEPESIGPHEAHARYRDVMRYLRQPVSIQDTTRGRGRPTSDYKPQRIAFMRENRTKRETESWTYSALTELYREQHPEDTDIKEDTLRGVYDELFKVPTIGPSGRGKKRGK